MKTVGPFASRKTDPCQAERNDRHSAGLGHRVGRELGQDANVIAGRVGKEINENRSCAADRYDVPAFEPPQSGAQVIGRQVHQPVAGYQIVARGYDRDDTRSERDGAVDRTVGRRIKKDVMTCNRLSGGNSAGATDAQNIDGQIAGQKDVLFLVETKLIVALVVVRLTLPIGSKIS